MGMYLVLSLVIALGIIGFFAFRRKSQVQGPFSLVLFLRKPITLSETQVRDAYKRAFGHDATVQQIPLPDGQGIGFLMISDQLPPLAVILASRPYMEQNEAEEMKQALEHPAVREAMTGHTSWLAVDAMQLDRAPKDKLGIIHAPLARLLAEFYDDNSVLILLRATNRVALPGDYVEVKLKQGRLDELFGDDSLHAPMFQVDGDDKAIENAKQEAKTRLPEFLAACRTRGADAQAMFKVGFPTSTDSAEFIWLSFSGFQGDDIVGIIENEPVDPKVPAKGTSVTINAAEIVDWAYIDEGEQPHGLFIDRVLMARSR